MDEKKSLTAAEVARLVGGELHGDGGVRLRGAASLEAAGQEDVSFLGNPRFREAAMKSRAGVFIVSSVLPKDAPQVVVSDPYSAFVKVVEYFHPERRPEAGIDDYAVVEAGAEVDATAHVGPLAVIGKGARIGAGSVVSAGCVVCGGAEVGRDCRLYPRVTLYPAVVLGDRVIIHSGTVIGSDGFGYLLSEQGHVKKPQVGRVVIEDEVEIGANCAIDRAMLDATVIGRGSKLDNLVHVAHGVTIGRHCIILAGVAIGGSARIGDYCIISGNATIKDNISLGDRAVVIGHSVVADDVRPGETVWGFPAMPFSLAKRVFARLKQLPELYKRVRELERAGEK